MLSRTPLYGVNVLPLIIPSVLCSWTIVRRRQKSPKRTPLGIINDVETYYVPRAGCFPLDLFLSQDRLALGFSLPNFFLFKSKEVL